MVLGNYRPDTVKVIVGLLAYGLLFAMTIRTNRRNRRVVLGVVTVATFVLFLLYASPAPEHTAPLLLVGIEGLIVLIGVSVLGLVAHGLIFDRSKRSRSEAAETPADSQSGFGIK